MFKYEEIESALWITFLYLAVLMLSLTVSVDNFYTFLSNSVIYYSIPIILIIIGNIIPPFLDYVNKYGFRIIDAPFDNGSFYLLVMVSPLISTFVFGMIYTILSTFLPFLPYPQAFKGL